MATQQTLRHAEARDVLQMLEEHGAIRHCGDPFRDPHFELSSGDHTCTYFDCSAITGTPDLLRQFSFQLNELITNSGGGGLIQTATCIAGPARGGTALARQLSEMLCNNCFVSPSPDPLRKGEYLPFTAQERARVAGHTVLLCDDVIMTGGSFARVATMVEEAGGRVLPYAVALINRSHGYMLNERFEILALVRKIAKVFKPRDCPLCALGSELIRPR